MPNAVDGPPSTLCRLTTMSDASHGRFDWSRLNHLQIGRYAEYLAKMEFTLHGFDVYGAEVDDKGIDFVVRRGPDRFVDVQVKSLRRAGYVFAPKTKFEPRETLAMALVLFRDGSPPDQFLIPAPRWREPEGIFVSRDYGGGLKSVPEWGVNVSARGMSQLEPFRFEHVVKKYR
jgi:hypothetical protein